MHDMQILGHNIDMGINLTDGNVIHAAKYAAVGYTIAELDLPIFFHEKRDMRVFEPCLQSTHGKIREAGLRVASIHLPFGTDWDISVTDEQERKNVVRDFSDVIRMTQGYEGEILVLHPSAEPISDDIREAKLCACEQSIAELVEVAKSVGKTLVLEDLPRTCLGNTSKEVARLTKNGTLLDCCMDTTHLLQEHILEYWDRCGAWVKHVHLSDYLTGAGECHWCPGTGDIPWKKLFERMFAANYPGVFMFEVGTKYVPLELLNGLKNAIAAELY